MIFEYLTAGLEAVPSKTRVKHSFLGEWEERWQRKAERAALCDGGMVTSIQGQTKALSAGRGLESGDRNGYAFVTLPLRRQLAHTRMRWLPPATLARTGRRLTFQRRRLTLCA